jgi:hypothetical protein
MKLVRTLSMIIALAGASTAHAQTKAPAEKQAPAKEELGKAEVAKAEKFFGELHGAVVKNQNACPKMATGINAVFDKYLPWLQKMAESGKDLPQASKDRLAVKMNEMAEGIMKCKDDKGVQAAMQRFATIAPKKAEAAPPPAPPAKK